MLSNDAITITEAFIGQIDKLKVDLMILERECKEKDLIISSLKQDIKVLEKKLSPNID